MIRVKIAYDPYHMKTSLNINGQNVKRVARGYERISNFVKQNIPLQSWIDPIPFQNWKGLLWEVLGNSLEAEVEFHFRGRKIDFLDLQEAMQAQSEDGKYKVEVTFPEEKQVFCYEDQVILERAKKAYELIQSEGFKHILDDKLFEIGTDSALYTTYQNLENRYKAAMDGEFRIVFSGMYTCGKSTIINAILGKEILPTRDGTCTSKVFKISHDPCVAFARMSCVDKDGKTVVEEDEYNEETLKKKFDEIFPRGDGDTLLPSNPPTIDSVLISTSMASLYPQNASYQQDDMKIVVVDTPGTSSGEGNSAVDGMSHFDIAKGVIESGKKEIVVFATNATTDKDTSIIDFLKMVDEGDPHRAYDQRYLFVLNKADDCSLKGDESWPKKLKGIQSYYTDGGKRAIKNPRFFPTSALAAFLVRADRAKGSQYGSIRENYYYYDEDTEETLPSRTKENFHFDEFCSTSQAIKDEISEEIARIMGSSLKPAEKRKQEILLHSGIVSLEMAIRDYIEKYAFPLKIQDLLQSYETIFHETNQLLNIASSNFDKALKARTDVDARKSAEEAERAETERVRESLINVSRAILDKKSRLDQITSTFRDDVKRQTSEIKIKMNLAIDDAKKAAKNNAKGDNVRATIKGVVDRAVVDCHSQITAHFSESREQTKKLETEILDFFREIQTVIDFGKDFSIDNTTDFHEISTDSISKVEDNIRTIRNPELDEGFFLIRPFLNIFKKKTIDVNDGIKLDDLNAELTKIRTAFDDDIDTTLSTSLGNLVTASEHLKRNLDKLEARIKAYAEQLSKMRANIERMAGDAAEKAALEKKLQEFKQLLSSIRNYTKFDEISED